MAQIVAEANRDIPNGGNRGGTHGSAIGTLPDLPESGSACPTAAVARSFDRRLAGLLAGAGSGSCAMRLPDTNDAMTAGRILPQPAIEERHF